MKYFNNRNFVIDGATFRYQGALFGGEGFMNWDHKEGFRVKLLVESEEYETPKTQTFGSPKVIKEEERNDIYLHIHDYGHKKAIVPNAYIGKRMSIDNTGTIIFKTPQLILLKENFYKESNYWRGRVTYRLQKGNYNLPEKIDKKEKIGGEEFREGWRNEGIQLKNEDAYLYGWLEEKGYLHIKFGLKKDNFSQAFALNFPCGFRHAISFLLGVEIKRLKSEVNGRESNVIVVKKLSKSPEMPIYRALKSFRFFSSQEAWQLSLFFTKGYLDIEKHKESYVARRMLNQLIEAEQQKTFAAKELLTSTILEAVLRTLFNVPSSNDLYVPHYLKNNFIPRYADGAEWREVRKKVSESFENMRHRNAHPDWLVSENNVYNDENISDTFHDLRVMIRFYQQMILLMAGVENVEPKLPEKL